MRKIILKNNLSPGDLVMLTAAVRDLHLSYPDCFDTDVRTSCPQLWENNPFITPLSEGDPDAVRPGRGTCAGPDHCLAGRGASSVTDGGGDI